MERHGSDNPVAGTLDGEDDKERATKGNKRLGPDLKDFDISSVAEKFLKVKGPNDAEQMPTSRDSEEEEYDPELSELMVPSKFQERQSKLPKHRGLTARHQAFALLS